MYFDKCRTIEEIKTEYRKLAKRLHPDCGGNQSDFVAMQAEFDVAFSRVKNTHTGKDGGTYEKPTCETPEQFRAAVEAVLNLDGVELEMVGGWIWASGNTYQYKELFKAAGYLWSSKHKKWFYNGEPKKSRIHSKHTFKQIEGIYGAAFIRKTAAATMIEATA